MKKFFKQFSKTRLIWMFLFCLIIVVGTFYFGTIFPIQYDQASMLDISKNFFKKDVTPTILALDKTLYDSKLEALANNPVVVENPATSPSDPNQAPVKPVETKPNLWPVKTVYPNTGAILPFKRIVAYYGNFYSKKMGVLGEYPEDQMLQMLADETKKWEAADPTTPVLPAIHYIAVTAQGSAGADGKYRLRMPDSQIDKAIEIAKKVNGIVFLDIQVALSDLQSELPPLEKYLKMPEVHLGIDPEFSMKTGKKPGSVIGSFDAIDINYAAEFLARIVKENNLTPKILIVHRFTGPMVTNYKNIKPLAEVQIVMDMDGWGIQARKINTYKQVIYKEPVQFAGFKLFYKNDFREPNSRILTPEEVLKLRPKPIYIQYQ